MAMNKIPEQKVGKSYDYSKEIILKNETIAFQKYREIVKKLLDVNQWHVIAKGYSSSFQIVNEVEEPQDRRVRKNDFIRIDVPGPGVPSAGGYDWVRVTALDQYEHNHKRKTFISLHPCPNPRSWSEEEAHFFKKFSSSNILIQQENEVVTLQYAGRNEVINMESPHLLDNIRNFLVGLSAKMGASFPQWKGLIDGLASNQS